MRRDFLKWLPKLVFPMCALTVASGQGEVKSPEPAETIHCRVLESGSSERLGVTWVIFHHRDAADRARLGELLRQSTGESAEFQTQGGQWQAATVKRLKTCFGRGLLFFSAGSAQLAEKDEFLLRIPKRKTTSGAE